jgi:cytochrome c oxidase subunit 2
MRSWSFPSAPESFSWQHFTDSVESRNRSAASNLRTQVPEIALYFSNRRRTYQILIPASQILNPTSRTRDLGRNDVYRWIYHRYGPCSFSERAEDAINQLNAGCRFEMFRSNMSAGQDWLHLAGQMQFAFSNDPTSIFRPAGSPAHSIVGLSVLVLSITAGIFLVVAGLLLYVLLRYRHRASSPDAEQEPAQIYGSNQIELSWTVIPGMIVVILFLATARVIFSTEAARKPAAALDVSVIGHQFWWEYRYPKLGIVTANELHIPVSDPQHPTPTYLTMSSADTDHSFWVPRLAGKTDLIPDKVNTMWLDPQAPGLYLGQCAQYCGAQHAKMLIRVYADSPAQFAAWVAQQQKTAAQDPTVAEGRAVFQHNACISCHTVAGTVATGKFGPDLTHVASRETIASGSVPNTAANIRAFVANPDHFKPGVLMPVMHLNDRDLDAVTAYLTTLK